MERKSTHLRETLPYQKKLVKSEKQFILMSAIMYKIILIIAAPFQMRHS